MNDAFSFLNRATRRVNKRGKTAVKAVKHRAKIQTRDTGHRLVEGFHNAYANASAHYEGAEALRGNKIAALQTPTPTKPIEAGQSTGPLTVQIKEGRYIRSFHSTVADEVNFLCTKFAVNGFDVVDGNPINMANFASFLSHIDRFGPMTGRRWISAITIDASFINVSGGPAIFHGINILMTDDECQPALKKAAPAPGFYSWRSVMSGLKKMMTPRRRPISG